jgi:hypothetical protein
MKKRSGEAREACVGDLWGMNAGADKMSEFVGEKE